MREARGSPFQAALGEREAQNPRKLDDEIRERLLKGPGMKGEKEFATHSGILGLPLWPSW